MLYFRFRPPLETAATIQIVEIDGSIRHGKIVKLVKNIKGSETFAKWTLGVEKYDTKQKKKIVELELTEEEKIKFL